MREFETEGEIDEFLRETVGPIASDALAAQFAVDLAPRAPKPPLGQRGFVVRRFKWVIQDDDLALLGSLGDGIKAAAAAGFFATATATAGAALTSAITGIVIALFTLLRQALKKGAILDADEIAVLAVLASSGRALPAAQIAQALQRDEALIETVLARLENVRLSNGQVKPFVAADAEKKWGAVDVGHVI